MFFLPNQTVLFQYFTYVWVGVLYVLKVHIAVFFYKINT